MREEPAETIFCTKCGEKNLENNCKCTRCGFPLHEQANPRHNVVQNKNTGLTWGIGCLVATLAIPIIIAIVGLLAAIGVPSILNAYQVSQEKAMERNVADVEKSKGMCMLPTSVHPNGIGAADGQQLTEEQVVRCIEGVDSLSDLNVGEFFLTKEDLIIGIPASYHD